MTRLMSQNSNIMVSAVKIGKNIKFDALVSNFGITKQQKTRDIKEQNNIFLENINTNLISTFNKINTCINIIKFKNINV